MACFLPSWMFRRMKHKKENKDQHLQQMAAVSVAAAANQLVQAAPVVAAVQQAMQAYQQQAAYQQQVSIYLPRM